MAAAKKNSEKASGPNATRCTTCSASAECRACQNLLDRIRAFQRSDKTNKRCADCTEVMPARLPCACLMFVFSRIANNRGRPKLGTTRTWTMQSYRKLGNHNRSGVILASVRCSLAPLQGRANLRMSFLRHLRLHHLWRASSRV